MDKSHFLPAPLLFPQPFYIELLLLFLRLRYNKAVKFSQLINDY